MTGDVARLVDMAREEIAVAERMIDGGFVRAGVSRAYYALFYVAEALLAREGKRYSKHSAVVSAHGSTFARTGRLAPRFHGYLKRAFEMRNEADYALVATVTQDQARTVIGWA
jgi:uncharacterized protein